jgi:hypothetical protein
MVLVSYSISVAVSNRAWQPLRGLLALSEVNGISFLLRVPEMPRFEKGFDSLF